MSARRLLLAVAIAFPALWGCQLSKSVSFTHEDTERMRLGEFADVPEYLRAGDGAFGITLIPHSSGFLVALPSYFADIHTRLVVKSVTILAPVRAEVALLDAPDWEPFESPNAVAHGSLGVAMMRGTLAERVISASGDVVLELDMDVDGEARTIVATLERSVHTYLWST